MIRYIYVAFPWKTERRVKNWESWLELTLSQLSLVVVGWDGMDMWRGKWWGLGKQLIADVISNSDHITQNTNIPTRVPNTTLQQTYSPDITTVSNTLYNRTSWKTQHALSSDHLSIITTISIWHDYRLQQTRRTFVGHNWRKTQSPLSLRPTLTSLTFNNKITTTPNYPLFFVHPSSTSINKLQVNQNAALRTATGCTLDTNIEHLHEETLRLPINEYSCIHFLWRLVLGDG